MLTPTVWTFYDFVYHIPHLFFYYITFYSSIQAFRDTTIVSDGKTSSVYGYTPGLNKRDWLYNCLATDINKRHNLMYVYIFIEKALNPVAFTDERKRDQYNYLFEGVNKALLLAGLKITKEGKLVEAVQA